MTMPSVNYTEQSLAKSLSYTDIISETGRLKDLTSNIPAMAKENPQAFEKAWRSMSKEKAARGPKAAFFDPLSLQYALGYKDRRYSLTYETLKRIASQLSIVAAIIATRVAQIASFSQPYRNTKSLGFVVKHKDTEHETSKSERRFIQQLETFVANCGEPGRPNPHYRHRRDDFETFLKKIVRDTLTYDQVAFEIVPRVNQLPYEFWAVDASTIRIASTDKDVGINWSYHDRNTPGNSLVQPQRFQGLYAGQKYGDKNLLGEFVQHVQIVNGQIENVYSNDELAFGIRNPRTDIYIQGYGFGELEQLVTITTALLYAEEYNKRYFTQGSHPKGLLNFKGDNWTPDQLEAFKRQWVASVSGVENAWKTPITQSEGLEWINLQMSNKDMEFLQWIEYCIKLVCGCYLIDPAEVNFDLHGGVQQTPLFESSQEWKLKASRDRGLRPLLKFIAKLINKHVIDKIDDHFVFEFIGLDELTEQEKHELLKEQTSSYMSLNEGRRSIDLPDIEIPDDIADLKVGDIPMNPAFLQAVQMKMQDAQAKRQEAQQKEAQEKQEAQQQQEQQQQEQQMQQQQQEQMAQQGEQQGEQSQAQMTQQQQQQQQEAQQQQDQQQGGAQPGAEGQPAEPPQYAANFGKSKSAEREIVVTFDDWIDQRRGE